MNKKGFLADFIILIGTGLYLGIDLEFHEFSPLMPRDELLLQSFDEKSDRQKP